MGQNRRLISQGHVLTMDPALGDFPRADILVEGDTIREVAPRIDVTDCVVLDATGMIVLPGFVDTHRHTWQTQLRNVAADWTLLDYTAYMRFNYGSFYRPEDAYLGNYAGALEALDAGITTLIDHSHIMNSPAHADAAVRGLQDAGIRAVFCYGMFENISREPGEPPQFGGLETPAWHYDDARRVRGSCLAADEGLVTMGVAMNEVEALPIEYARQEIEFAREIGAHRISVHVGMGALSKEARFVERLGEAGLLGPDLLFVHGSSLSDDALRLAADCGAAHSITPETEMQMGMGIPVTGRVLKAGGRASFGIDIVSNNSGDMFAQMRLGLQMERAWRNRSLEKRGFVPTALDFPARTALELATAGGARAAGLDARVGSLTPGKQADIVLLRCDGWSLCPVNDPVGAVVLSANAAAVDSVFVAGRPVKRDGRLCGIDAARVRDGLRASRDYVMGRAATVNMDEVRELIAFAFPVE